MIPVAETAPAPVLRTYRAQDRSAVLALFDANCPQFFAANERADYQRYLDAQNDAAPVSYRVLTRADRILGAFGITTMGAGEVRLNWIMLHPDCHGGGLGSLLLERAVDDARGRRACRMHIAASHLSAAFFGRHGALEAAREEDGWGPGMHRVDMVLAL